MLEKNDLNRLVMRLADNQFLYRLDDSLMWLFDIETGKHYKLNEPSYFVLSLFDGERTIAEIRRLFVERYSGSGVAEAELLEDFKSLMNHLINDDLITLRKKIIKQGGKNKIWKMDPLLKTKKKKYGTRNLCLRNKSK